MPRSIPPPPRALIMSLALIAAVSFLGGILVNRVKIKHGNYKTKAAARPSGARTAEVRIFVPDKGGAAEFKKEYESKGYRVTESSVQNKIPVQEGYIAADRLDPAAAKPVAETLSEVYHFPVSLKVLTRDRTLVQVGTVYERKEDADKLVQQLKSLGYHWKSEPHWIEKPERRFEVRIEQVPLPEAQALKKSIRGKEIKVEIVPSP